MVKRWITHMKLPLTWKETIKEQYGVDEEKLTAHEQQQQLNLPHQLAAGCFRCKYFDLDAYSNGSLSGCAVRPYGLDTNTCGDFEEYYAGETKEQIISYLTRFGGEVSREQALNGKGNAYRCLQEYIGEEKAKLWAKQDAIMEEKLISLGCFWCKNFIPDLYIDEAGKELVCSGCSIHRKPPEVEVCGDFDSVIDITS